MAKKFSYSEATQEIEQIIDQLEAGDLEIDELSTKVKRASQLIKKCKDHLKTTEDRVNEILDEDQDNG
ncbi:Exodeoxyribonuclease 7 small subunit [Salinivirga cyanobacteriivorans]|uniref:Exodeoxyribonuclease 7 small subunit n=1 Tax=Salinivirga cyanobacteriivorans TaxID=1307839 RepID=A0A0S2I166_9BACT|nr:exodeoxyribonuclease VII small subunit [Salinivirga cyanobacteriivorans]ALO16120.1 Exodeoxyribonuclease 7 small subunit [Salinivirga cyanobacteriivorans]